MRESYQTSKILQTGSELIELLDCKQLLPFKKKEEQL